MWQSIMNTKRNKMSLLPRIFQFSEENNTEDNYEGKEEGVRSSCQAKWADVMVTELKKKKKPICLFWSQTKCSLNLLYWWYNTLSETESLQ